MIYRTAVACALALTTAVAAQTAKRDPMTMEGAGVRLAMPYAQAKAGAEALGYSCQPFGKALTFDERVAKAVDGRKGVSTWLRAGTGTSELTCVGPSGESLRIFLAQPRGGAVVDRFELRFDGSRSDLAAVRRQLAERYGAPAAGRPGRTDWCMAARCEGLTFAKSPTFSVDTLGAISVMATWGSRATEAEAAAVEAAADRVAPKRAGGAL